MNVLGVGELTESIARLLEREPLLADIWVRGEVSNLSRPPSGHVYFTLKDAKAELGCVMWRSQARIQRYLPATGAEVTCHGHVAVYRDRGRYQLYVDHVEPAGQGDLYLQVERLKARLTDEGLFAAEAKRSLPRFPMTIGVVTSKDAAALQDVLTVLERRWPAAEVVLAPAPVQGPEAAPLLVEALRAVARTPAELVILARGGGSIEELWAFHNEGLARAIRACPVPVVTGVGHETDVTIADLAADVRAPTPSAAAELATPNRAELRESVDRVVGRGRSALSRRLDVAAQAHRTTAARLALAAPTRRLAERAEGVARLRRALDQGMSGRLRLVQADVSGLSARVRSLGPEPTLQRGYAVVLRARDGRAVTRSRDVRPGEALRVRLAEGAIAATVDRIEERDT